MAKQSDNLSELLIGSGKRKSRLGGGEAKDKTDGRGCLTPHYRFLKRSYIKLGFT